MPDRDAATTREQRLEEVLDSFVAAGYECILAANGMIRYVDDDGKGAIMAYDRWRVKLSRAVDDGMNLIRERNASKPKKRGRRGKP